MQVHGIIHTFPREIKTLIVVFLVMLTIGFFTGLAFINDTTQMQPEGIEMQYLGNEVDENVTVMKFKKSEREMLTLVHNHILSLSLIFFVLALILSTTSINKKLKHFLMLEPLFSVLFTFGGIYLMWTGITWFKYIVMISGTLMTLSFGLAVIIILMQILKVKN
jgi:hypothetical protein